MRRLSVLAVLLSPCMAVAQPAYLVDWDAVGREATDHLVELVTISALLLYLCYVVWIDRSEGHL